MKIIVSPAKKMRIDTDTFPVGQLPFFLERTRALMEYMRGLTYEEAQRVWNCGERIAKQNYERFQTMELDRRLTPALISYEGIQYQYMAPGVMEQPGLDYLGKHLYILSGFYGILRAFDGVVPYRLEMQAKLLKSPYQSLYQYWGSSLSDFLSAEDGWILNLASREYSRCVSATLSKDIPFVTCVFGEWKNGKVIEKGTLAKMARGEMVRFLAENRIFDLEGVKEFCGLGYHFQKALSSGERLVFLKQEDSTKGLA